jgi:hypothetical protein
MSIKSRIAFQVGGYFPSLASITRIIVTPLSTYQNVQTPITFQFKVSRSLPTQAPFNYITVMSPATTWVFACGGYLIANIQVAPFPLQGSKPDENA